ncbi:hypothetical protein PTT_19192 [Pyrenophora teres f. teres 0-1]|uniref:Uncharacterized protein n=1 Tax=Pyrenophora teres f. teres (strain 0-1) TaxID=861557 RepID=E3S8E4_PYRTT|nr:hypothetical protein PTT_19192 [Pyrenophora teres f. teres 0-1]
MALVASPTALLMRAASSKPQSYQDSLQTSALRSSQYLAWQNVANSVVLVLKHREGVDLRGGHTLSSPISLTPSTNHDHNANAEP